MKITHLSSAVALLHAPAVFAQATTTSEASTTTTTTAASSCTASLVTTLCDYKDPGPEFAVAIDSRASCWEYCNDHQPCDFVIFAAGNPYTGTGTCWVYPGEKFDESTGESSSCGNPYLSVYNKPECAEPSTPTTGTCAATASPSTIATICDYPAPDDCFYTCSASEGASSCLSECADAESCSYAVFNPRNPSNSPYASGTCWIYTNGTYDAASAGTCSGKPEQFVYENPCPKPPASSSSPSASPSSSSSSSSPSATASPNDDKTESAGYDSALTPTTPNTAPLQFSFSLLSSVGTIAVLWQGLL
ncbi:hypothetical protein BU23DRAFT_561854 [Bimuria novae-zelandiae CBS 107.79]|uniref:Apple domain-containing protein n=1 Tax=Bimuria novae-zelandiae CBS 107.79 TaxID=1447943 RepID=A0A6A5UH24_9PLEO|nr:hypothetical protein BU23DRAFT_561854 [Bimuria novae-zelandiae CBS 107.79]